jgi:NAD+ synthase (glutamine-hydrolysing)
MALSNERGAIVLTTGNKSEYAVGYATLYGDMAGGFAPLKDVLKGDVYALARHANRDAPRIPTSTIEKPPSAELRPGSSTGLAARLRRARRDPAPGSSRSCAASTSWSRRDSTETRCSASSGSSTERSTSAARPLPARRSRVRAFGRERRVPITSGFDDPKIRASPHRPRMSTHEQRRRTTARHHP